MTLHFVEDDMRKRNCGDEYRSDRPGGISKGTMELPRNIPPEVALSPSGSTHLLQAEEDSDEVLAYEDTNLDTELSS